MTDGRGGGGGGTSRAPAASAPLIAAAAFSLITAFWPGSGAAFPAGHGPGAEARKAAMAGFEASASAQAEEPDLEAILRKAAEYCARLEAAAFDFTCREELEEKIDPSFDVKPRSVRVSDWATPGYFDRKGMMPIARISTKCLYDYQYVRSGSRIVETRTLLRENGKDVRHENAPLKTTVFSYGNILMGPIGMFAARFQPTYEFRIAGRDRIGKKRVVIVAAAPKIDGGEVRSLFGRAWIDPATADILKIEWDESRVRHYEAVAERAKRYGRTPRLTIRSEFDAEKNGLRFPNRLTIEEAYLNTWGRPFVRSETTVVYKDFKFFTVEVDVK